MNRYKFIDEKKEHLHTLDGKPLIGTTTALGVISKPFTWWASGLAVGNMGWLASNRDKDGKIPFKDKLRTEARAVERKKAAADKLLLIKNLSPEQYLALLDESYRAHNTKKEDRAQEGIDLHDMAADWIDYCLKFYKGIPAKPLIMEPKLKSFIEWCEKNVKSFLFSEIHCFSEKLWVGGKVDLGFVDSKNQYILSDIKSRDADYLSDHLQIGGYDIQLSENGGFDKDGNLIWKMEEPFSKHCVFTLGDKFTEPVFSKSIDLNKRGFESALELHKIRSQFEEGIN